MYFKIVVYMKVIINNAAAVLRVLRTALCGRSGGWTLVVYLYEDGVDIEKWQQSHSFGNYGDIVIILGDDAGLSRDEEIMLYSILNNDKAEYQSQSKLENSHKS